MFGQSILVPDLSRRPPYDSLIPDVGRLYNFQCICGLGMQVDLHSYVGNYEDRETILGEENSEEIRKHFNLRRDNSLQDGWPKFRIEACSSCGEEYLVYLAVFEPSNGRYKIVPQGITQLTTRNKSHDQTNEEE